MQRKLEEFNALSAEVIAVSPDGITETRELAGRLGLTYPVLSDPALESVDAYGVRHVGEPHGRLIPRPSSFVIDRQGMVVFEHVGENPVDRPAEEALVAVLSTIRCP